MQLKSPSAGRGRGGVGLALLGFIFKQEKGDPILRAEFLFLDGKGYGMRSSPT